MKTFIKKPEKVELFKMEGNPVSDKGVFDDMENTLCGWVDGLLEQLGCDDTPDIISEALCGIFSPLGESLGCEELDPGECDIGADCEEFQECVDGLCITPEGVCFDSEDCVSPEVCQDLGCCLPMTKICNINADCCDGLVCGGLILMEEGVTNNVAKTCQLPIMQI